LRDFGHRLLASAFQNPLKHPRAKTNFTRRLNPFVRFKIQPQK
jgi:hypothetical protein